MTRATGVALQRRLQQLAAERLLEAAVIGEAGERVGLGQVAQLRTAAGTAGSSATRVRPMPSPAEGRERQVVPREREPEDCPPEQGEAHGSPGHHPAVGTAGMRDSPH